MGPSISFRAVDAEAAKFILTQKVVQKSFLSDTASYLQEWFVSSVPGVDGEDWRRQRSIVNPAFNQNAYKSYYPAFVDSTEKIIQKFHDNISSDIEVSNWLHKYTIDLLGKAIFTYDFGTMDGKHNEYYEAYKHIMDNLTMLSLLLFPSLEHFHLPYIEAHKNSFAKLQELFKRMIAERKAKENPKENDVLDRMLKTTYAPETTESNGNKNPHLTERELYSNLFVFFLAGHDTTAAALSWAIVNLVKYPEEQQKLYDEINSTLGDRHPNFDDLDKLPYMDQFIHETLRMGPPAADIITRVTTTDIIYPVEGKKDIFIPKGSLIGLDINTIHHSPKYWEDPYKFNPSRFSPENKKGKHKFQYLPFSLGPRECLGTRFSLIEQHLFLTRFLQEFKVEEPEKEKFEVIPSRGINKPQKVLVKLTPRNK